MAFPPKNQHEEIAGYVSDLKTLQKTITSSTAQAQFAERVPVFHDRVQTFIGSVAGQDANQFTLQQMIELTDRYVDLVDAGAIIITGKIDGPGVVPVG